MTFIYIFTIIVAWTLYFIAKKYVHQRRKRNNQKLLDDLAFFKKEFDRREWRYKARSGAITNSKPADLDFFKMLMSNTKTD